MFEILRGLREGRFIEKKGDGTWASTQAIREIKVPSSVQELVASRLAALTIDERNVLDVAACAGIEFDPLLVATALGQPRMAVLQRLAWIEKTHRLVRGAGRVYAFDHAQIHETLLAALPVLLREEYHGAIGDALAARHGTDMPGAVAAQAARHFLAAGRPDRAAEFGARGLEHLRAAEAYTAAAELATGLLAAPGAFTGAARLALLVKHVRVLGIVGRREAERAAIDESLTLAEELADAPARVQALTSLGWHFIRTARAREAVTVLETAMRGAVEVADPRLEAAAAGHLGMALWDLGRYDEARAALTRQLRIARDLADGAGEAGACGNLGLVEYSIGRYAEAKAHHERHLAWAKASGARRALAVASGNLGIVLLSLGRFEDSLVHVETQLATSREVGDRRGESIALGNLGNLHYARGRWGDALAVIELGLRVSREIGDRVGEASVLVNLGPYAALLGDRERCADALDAGLALSRDIGARYQEGYALFGLGELAETDGDEARAVAHGERALALRREIGHRDGVAESLVALARLRIAAGEHLAARALLEEAASIARELGLAGPQALAAAHAARLPAGDVAACRAAYDACASRMMLRDRMEAAWVLGRAAGDPRIIDDARRAFETALDGAPSERRDAMAWRVPLHRAIAEFTGRTPPSDRTTPAAPYV